ncbi:MAG: hypothetical protein GEV28_16180 [Actinophytocola sp.]|uniref:hypothetical protein n=1 Tax=Actinophytocola sp. TaxID=1872138 RepID=UPI00132A7EFC|nr:hypothetical protein [Actinophytocola sp.]MPZ81847.1 hypothetical protein [Actinophytocola sp.]
MRSRPARFPLALAVALLVLTGCGADSTDEPGPVRFTRVVLPAGGTPEVLAGTGDTLLIGVRREGAQVVPGLLRRGPDGKIAEIAVHPGTPYGREAFWYSLTTDGERIVAIGGKRGGAHGNVRWSAWTGSDAGITEKEQAFSTFGGLGAGDLTAAVHTPAGPMLVGTWESEQVGLDIRIWTQDGDLWLRGPAAGTALENRRESLKFPMAATALRQGILVAGWELSGGKQRPVVWQSGAGNTGWTMTALPDAAAPGVAVAARCWESACAIAGRVDDKLAVWSLTDGRWARLAGVPAVAVADDEKLAAPVDVDGRPTQVINDGDAVRIAFPDRDGWTVRSVARAAR